MKKLLKYNKGYIWFEGKFSPDPYAGFFKIFLSKEGYHKSIGQPYILIIGITSPVHCSLSALNLILNSWDYESISEKDFENE